MERRINCSFTGMQNGEERFSDQDPDGWPTLKGWRCDLTALSHVYNLYFVACNDTIHVYQPSFPDQTLALEPSFVLFPPTTPNSVRGIDFEDPHSITRLHLDSLGEDEILLATCDDGDVVGYRTKDIQGALEGRIILEHDSQQRAEVRPFIHVNVGASAWGLAVHREARMIAISANTHQVTVWAPALAQDDSEKGLDDIVSRHEDTAIMLIAGSNVPSVTFNNSGDDPSGRWLVSSEIEGETLIWDLHKRNWNRQGPVSPALTLQMGWCASVVNPLRAPSSCACSDSRDYPHAAWGAMFLNTDTAYEVSQAEEALMKPNQVYPGFREVTASKDGFLISSSPFDYDGFDGPEQPSSGDEEHGAEDHMMLLETESEDGMASGTDETSQHSSHYAESGLMPNENTNLSAPNEQIGDERKEEEENDSDNETYEFTDVPAPWPHWAFPSAPIAPEKPFWYIQQLNPITPPPISLPGPLLIITKEELFLIQHPFSHASEKFTDLVQCICSPLHHTHRSSLHGVSDRMCFSSQIPELGLFIVGSPIGRVAIFSIYWTRKEGTSQPRYGFNLEYILPFTNGNDRRVRNVRSSMVGVAVGPLQGMLDKTPAAKESAVGEQQCRQSRRWRLLMYYADHSVVSFELSRPRRKAESGVEELVV